MVNAARPVPQARPRNDGARAARERPHERQREPAALPDTLTVTVQGNQAPVLDLLMNRTGHPTQIVSFYANAIDPDGDMITYSLVTAPANASIDPNTGHFTWAPAWNQLGAQTVTIRAADPGGLSSQQSCTITVANQAPSIDPLPNRNANPGHAVTFYANATDPDGDPVTYSLIGQTYGASINMGTGQFTWVPPAQLGMFTFTVQAADPGGLTAQASFNITVSDDGPALDALPNRTAHPGQLLSFYANASDPDGDLITYNLVTPPSGATINPGSGLFTWTPGWNQIGSFTITIRASDPAQVNTQGSCTVTVSDPGPSLDPLPDRQAAVGRQLAFYVNASEPNCAMLTFSITNQPGGATIDANTGHFTWTPMQAGAFSFTVRVADPAGLAASGSFNVTAQ
jgi:hypothetical protein